MLKTIASLLVIFSLSACFSSSQNDQVDFDVDPNMAFDESGDFDVVADEDMANEINAQTQQEIEEVEVSDRIFFGLDQNSLSAEAQSTLDTQAAWLKSDYGINVVIEGHCDERGAREYNIALGERRAEAVKDYLVSAGVSASRIKTVSYGKEKPAFVGSGEGIWSKNRRAVTVIEE